MLSVFENLVPSDRRERAYWLSAWALILFGVLLRSLGYFDGKNGLWNDEANWVLRIAGGQGAGGIRPPGYWFLSRGLIAWHPSEAVLRSSSYLAGVLALPLFWGVARRLAWPRGTTLLGLFALAVHPWLISFAKEFKPYGLEFGLHVALLYAALAYLQRPTFRLLLGVGVFAVASLLFAWNVIFLLPGMAALFLANQLRQRLRAQWLLMAGVSGLSLLVVVVLHSRLLVRLFSSRGISSQRFWGEKHDVFFLIKHKPWLKLEWLANKTQELARLPGELRAFWDSSGQVARASGVAFALLVVLGIVVLVAKRKWTPLVLWLSPWLLTVVANWLGFWPYGVFRTNVYLIPYALGLGLSGWAALEELEVRGFRLRRPMQVLALGWACLFCPYDLHYFTYKDVATGAFASSIGESLETIANHEAKTKGRVEVFLDGYACGTFKYYHTLHPSYRRLGKFVRRHLTVRCTDNSVPKLERLVKGSKQDHVWVITGRPATAQPIRAFLTKKCDLPVAPHLPTADTLFLCRPKGR